MRRGRIGGRRERQKAKEARKEEQQQTTEGHADHFG
jgi:hypothetical protein